MKIKDIVLSNEGSLNCKSCRYTAYDTMQLSMSFHFSVGINYMMGDIDSGIWGVSYLLSMYHRKYPQYFYKPLSALVNGEEMSIEALSKYCCYMDEEYYPLFSSKRKTVRYLIEKGLKKSKIDKTFDEIFQTFGLSSDRLDRPICHTGNEKIRAMAAVGYAHGKQVFCFPWLSQKMVEYYKYHLLWTFDALEKLGAIVIFPSGAKEPFRSMDITD